jgi:hypothetical protein
MLKRLLLVLLIVSLTACGEDSSEENGGIESANQEQRSANTDTAPTIVPAIRVPAVSSVQLENVPDQLAGQLVMTWDGSLFVVPFDGTSAEPLLKNVAVRGVHGNKIITVTDQANPSHSVSLLDSNTGEQTRLFDLEPDEAVRVDKWSPNGQWFTMHIEKTLNELPGGNRFSLTGEPIDYVLFDTDGRQIELPITSPEGTTRAGGGWLSDNTLLIADGINQRRVTRLLRFDPISGDVNELDLSDISENFFSILIGFYSDFARERLNSDLETLGLELVHLEGAYDLPRVVAPDDSYSVELDLQGWGTAGVCAQYWVTQEAREESFTTRLLHSGDAQNVSNPLLNDERVYFFQTASPTCLEDDLQVNLMRIENFENPAVDILYTAKPASEFTATMTYSYLEHGQYLLWTAINGANTEIFVTDLNANETTVLLSVPYTDGQEIPTLNAVIGDR